MADLDVLQSDLVVVQERDINDNLIRARLSVLEDDDRSMRQRAVRQEVQQLGVERKVEGRLGEVTEVMGVNIRKTMVEIDLVVVVRPAGTLHAVGMRRNRVSTAVHDRFVFVKLKGCKSVSLLSNLRH